MKKEFIHFLKELKAYGIKENIPNVTETGGRFLNMILKIRRPKQILEIGCANGYSTLWMAEAAHQIGAKITTVDFSEPTFKQAKENIEKVGYENLVEFHLGNALTIIPTFTNKVFDFVFIDGQKRSYLDFWNIIQNKLTDDAVIIFDDILAFPEKTKPLISKMEDLKGFDQVILPIDQKDGILMLIKNKSWID